MLLKRELVQVGLEAADANEALRQVAQPFADHGYAKPRFPQAVIDRELMFPTGLPARGVDVAIPHADASYVIKDSLAIATLRNPVTFRMMGGGADALVQPRILFMLGIVDARTHLEALQRLMDLLNDEELLAACLACASPDELYELMAERIG